MSKASEDVLLIVKHVKYKKVEGSLYVMSTRAAWMNQTGDTFRVSAPYESVRVQRISPDTKEKVQLQLLLLDGASYTFHFTHPSGKNQQLEDRNSVKELLQQLLPKFKDKVTLELEAKNRVLQKRPELFQLYKDLVVSTIVSPEEFWANQKYQSEPEGAKSAEGQSSASVGDAAEKNAVSQEVGVTGHFLSDIKPQVDGANGMKYHLTNDLVLSIFKTYPAVKERHQRLVPHQVSEKDFWIKFFQSHYFHRDRLHLSRDDIFSECARRDEEQLKEEAKRVAEKEPSVSLAQASDRDLEPGYGLEAAVEEDGKGKESAAHLTNLQLIRRYNHHSLMVLKSAGGRREEEVPAKKARLSETIPDLEPAAAELGAELQVADKIERYLQGPTLQQRARLYVSQDDAMRASHAVRQQLARWPQLQLDKCLNHSAAVRALGALSTALSPGLSGAPSGPSGSGASGEQLLSPDQSRELSQLHGALAELLRHFWLCFPVSSPQLEEKAGRMAECLHKFEELKLRPFRQRVLASIPNSVKEINVTGHLEAMLDAALKRYTAWRQKRRR